MTTQHTIRNEKRQGRDTRIAAAPSAPREFGATLRQAEWRPETSSLTRAEMRRIVAEMVG